MASVKTGVPKCYSAKNVENEIHVMRHIINQKERLIFNVMFNYS